MKQVIISILMIVLLSTTAMAVNIGMQKDFDQPLSLKLETNYIFLKTAIREDVFGIGIKIPALFTNIYFPVETTFSFNEYDRLIFNSGKLGIAYPITNTDNDIKVNIKIDFYQIDRNLQFYGNQGFICYPSLGISYKFGDSIL